MILRKWHSSAVAALFAAATFAAAATPAAAQYRRHGGGHPHYSPHYSHHAYRGYPGRHYAGHYHGPRHYYWHGSRRYYGYGWGYDPWGAVAAAGVIGLAAGAIAAGAAAPARSVAWCEARYRSYDPGTGTYMGYDGRLHPCP